MRTKSKSKIIPDRIHPDIILRSKHGAIFTVSELSDKKEKLPTAHNTKAPLLKERAKPEIREKKRKPPFKFVPYYQIIHYHKGIPLEGSSLCMTIEQLKAQEVQIIKLDGQKRRIKGSIASKSLTELTSSIKFER